jgi:MFS family permease
VRDLPLAMGIWGAYMPLGQALVALYGAWVVVRTGWQALWVVTAIASALTVLASIRLLPPARPGASRPRRRAAPVRPTEPRERLGLLLLAGVFATYTLQWMALASYLPTLLTDLGVRLTVSGALTCVVLAGNVAGNVAAGALARRGVPSAPALAVALTVMLLSGALVFAPSTPVAARLLCALAFSTVGGAVPGTLFGLVAALRAPGPGRRNAVLVQGSQLGSALGPLLVGWAVARAGGWHAASGLILACGLIGLGLTAVWARGEPSRPAADLSSTSFH